MIFFLNCSIIQPQAWKEYEITIDYTLCSPLSRSTRPLGNVTDQPELTTIPRSNQRKKTVVVPQSPERSVDFVKNWTVTL
ncbi:hypothetical protein Bca4012_024865 [Brassica carinata]|uniref:Uncharacterized protein n=1 Tax=Brassica carinata TaxID=52824 RepID=A0A8X7VF84_BRACI|nr:hypothetical protein Bca52824_021912 [Brassica carinata]